MRTVYFVKNGEMVNVLGEQRLEMLWRVFMLQAVNEMNIERLMQQNLHSWVARMVRWLRSRGCYGAREKCRAQWCGLRNLKPADCWAQAHGRIRPSSLQERQLKADPVCWSFSESVGTDAAAKIEKWIVSLSVLLCCPTRPGVHVHSRRARLWEWTFGWVHPFGR